MIGAPGASLGYIVICSIIDAVIILFHYCSEIVSVDIVSQEITIFRITVWRIGGVIQIQITRVTQFKFHLIGIIEI